jgi:hypothetical protein
MVLKIPHRTWFDWYVYVGGLILIGVLFGFCIGFLARYLWLPSLSSRSLRRRRKRYSANEWLLLLIETLGIRGEGKFGKHPKIAKDLDDGDPDRVVDVIVQFKQTPTEKHHLYSHSIDKRDYTSDRSKILTRIPSNRRE